MANQKKLQSTAPSVDQKLPKGSSFWIVIAILVFAGLGLLVIGLDSRPLWARGLILSGAYLAVGFLGGFLFAIPKVLQIDRDQTKDDQATGTFYRQRVNTNLEDISDWLTKIIVGLGLYELKRIPAWIDELATMFASSFQQSNQGHGVFAAAIVYFFVVGFLLGYLITRLYLQGALGRADRSAVEDPAGGVLKKQDPQSGLEDPAAGQLKEKDIKYEMPEDLGDSAGGE